MDPPPRTPQVCCDGVDQPRQAYNARAARCTGYATDWFLSIFADRDAESGTFALNHAPFTHALLHASLNNAFVVQYAETTTRVTLRTRTTHYHSNVRFAPPGPCKSDLKQWAANLFTPRNAFVASQLASWTAVDRWPAADAQTTVEGVLVLQTTPPLMNERDPETKDAARARLARLFEDFETEGPDHPMGHCAMWGVLDPAWGKDDVIRFLRLHAAYVHNTSLYILRRYNHETRCFELDICGKDIAKATLEKVVYEWTDLNPSTGRREAKRYTGVDYMTGKDILTFAAVVFDPSSPDSVTGDPNQHYLDPTRRVFNLFRGFGFVFSPLFEPACAPCPDIAPLPGRIAPADTRAVLAAYGVAVGHPAELFLRHGYEVLSAGDRACFEYLVRWIAHIFQYPASKPGTAVLVRSSQGAGKNIWFNILRPLIGRRYYVDITNKEHLSQKFNAHLANKLFCLVDECVFGGAHEVNNIIKGLITQEDVLMEKKFSDAVQTTSYQRFAFLSNESWPVKIETSDRRFVCLEASPLRIAHSAYFDTMAGYYGSHAVQEALFHFFMNVQGVPALMPRPPQTTLHEELMEKSMPLELQFMRDIAVSSEFTDRFGIMDEAWVTTQFMTERMREWADDNALDGKRVASIKRMGSLLGKILGDKSRVLQSKVVGCTATEGARSWAYRMQYDKVLRYRP